jgi:pyridoxamine 5'-phosphate oxidase
MDMDNEAPLFPGRPIRPRFADDLALTLEEAWASLDRGVRNRRSPFHTPAVATLGLDGRPRVRTVVLRGADSSERFLRFHTDIRGEKVAEIRRDDRVALHAYDPRAKFQVRVEGRANIHADDALADSAWDVSKLMSRACYGTQPKPGVALEHADSFVLPGDEEEISAGRENFSVVLIRVESIETLYLDHAGHRRARFELGDMLDARWLTP